VVASSDKAYGTQPALPYREDHPLAGRHPYDVSKSCTDLIAQSYACTYDLPIVVTRCGNLYGGGDLNWSRLVPGTIRSALQGDRPVLRSDGTLIRDYLYVEDAAEAYIGLAERAHEPGIAGEAWNYSNELQLTAAGMTRRVLAACGRADLELDIRGEAVHEIAHQYLSAAKARERLGWAPAHGLDEGLRRTVAWYRRHLTREIGCAA
jgi:CDP-glucose 4,6-dehydratase